MTREQVKTREDSWKYRRAMVFLTVGAMIAMLGYLTVWADTANVVQSSLAQTLPLGIVGTVMAYIGGPIADDWLQLRKNS